MTGNYPLNLTTSSIIRGQWWNIAGLKEEDNNWPLNSEEFKWLSIFSVQKGRIIWKDYFVLFL